MTATHQEASGKAWPGAGALRWTFDGYLRYTAKHGRRGAHARLRCGLLLAALWRTGLHAGLFALCTAVDALRRRGVGRTPRTRVHREKAEAFAAITQRLVRPAA